MFQRLKETLAIYGFAGAYWLYSRLWRVRHVNFPSYKEGPVIFAHWHGDELLLIGAFIGKPMAVMASRSRDGERLKRILNLLGYQVARGSSSKGGAGGLKGLIDVVNKTGTPASLAVDGPRGPIYKVKPGILKLAEQTGARLVPGAAAAKQRFIFKKAWNRCYLPLPFSSCVVVYGDPIRVPTDLDPERFETMREELEGTLTKLKIAAEATFDREFSPTTVPALATSGV